MLPLCNLPITASQWWLIELGINDYKCTLWYKVKVSKFQIIIERHMEYEQLENKQSYLNVHTILLLIIGVLLRSISNPRWWELRSGMKSCFSHLWEKKRKKPPSHPADLISLADLQSPISLRFTWLAVGFMTAGPPAASIFYSQQPAISQTTFSGLQFNSGLLVLAVFFSSLLHLTVSQGPCCVFTQCMGSDPKAQCLCWPGGISMLGLLDVHEKDHYALCMNTSGELAEKVRKWIQAKIKLWWNVAARGGFSAHIK